MRQTEERVQQQLTSAINSMKVEIFSINSKSMDALKSQLTKKIMRLFEKEKDEASTRREEPQKEETEREELGLRLSSMETAILLMKEDLRIFKHKSAQEKSGFENSLNELSEAWVQNSAQMREKIHLRVSESEKEMKKVMSRSGDLENWISEVDKAVKKLEKEMKSMEKSARKEKEENSRDFELSQFGEKKLVEEIQKMREKTKKDTFGLMNTFKREILDEMGQLERRNDVQEALKQLEAKASEWGILKREMGGVERQLELISMELKEKVERKELEETLKRHEERLERIEKMERDQSIQPLLKRNFESNQKGSRLPQSDSKESSTTLMITRTLTDDEVFRSNLQNSEERKRSIEEMFSRSKTVDYNSVSSSKPATFEKREFESKGLSSIEYKWEKKEKDKMDQAAFQENEEMGPKPRWSLTKAIDARFSLEGNTEEPKDGSFGQNQEKEVSINENDGEVHQKEEIGYQNEEMEEESMSNPSMVMQAEEEDERNLVGKCSVPSLLSSAVELNPIKYPSRDKKPGRTTEGIEEEEKNEGESEEEENKEGESDEESNGIEKRQMQEMDHNYNEEGMEFNDEDFEMRETVREKPIHKNRESSKTLPEDFDGISNIHTQSKCHSSTLTQHEPFLNDIGNEEEEDTSFMEAQPVEGEEEKLVVVEVNQKAERVHSEESDEENYSVDPENLEVISERIEEKEETPEKARAISKTETMGEEESLEKADKVHFLTSPKKEEERRGSSASSELRTSSVLRRSFIRKSEFVEGDSGVVEILMDGEGFLIDKEGKWILDDHGEPIKLTEEQIMNLQSNDQYEEIIENDLPLLK